MNEYDITRTDRRAKVGKDQAPESTALLTEDELKGIAYAETINRMQEAHQRAAWNPHTVFSR